MSGPPAATPAPVRSLVDDLRARTDAELADLLQSRPDLLHPLPSDMTALAARASAPPSVLRALERLNRWQLQVLELLVALTGEQETVDLGRLIGAVAGVTAEQLDAALGELRRLGLVWGSTDRLHPVSGVREAFGPYPCGLAGPGVGRVGPAISDPRALLEQAPQQAREVFALLSAGPPVGSVSGADRAVTPGSAATPVEWLLAHRLLVPIDSGTVVIPREISLAFRGGAYVVAPQPEPPLPDVPAGQPDADAAARTAAAQAEVFVRLVATLVREWGQRPPPQLRSGGLGVRDLTGVARLLDVDDVTAALVVEVTHAAGLIASDEETEPVWLPTTAADAWLEGDVASRWATLALAWSSSTRVMALIGSRDDRNQRRNALVPDIESAAAAPLRRLILRALALLLPTGTPADPTAVEAIVTWLRPRDPSRLRGLMVRESLREAAVLGVTGSGYLAPPARVLPGAGDRADPALLIAAALRPLLPEPIDHVLLQADLTAIAPGPLVPDVGATMALLSDVESTGGATVSRFSAASIRRGLDAGMTSSSILEFLARHSRTPVPQPLSYLVEDVARRHGSVRVGAARSYLRCDDPSTLDTMLATKALRDLGLFKLAPTVLASSVPVAETLAALRAGGFTPMAETPDGVIALPRAQSRRAPSRNRRRLAPAWPPTPTDDLVAAAAAALRAADRAAETVRDLSRVDPRRIPVQPLAETLSVLQDALAAGLPVLLGYSDVHGRQTEHLLDPVRIERGAFVGYDHRYEEVRPFLLSRITGAVLLDDD